jgi:hypothetical protein
MGGGRRAAAGAINCYYRLRFNGTENRFTPRQYQEFLVQLASDKNLKPASTP